MKIDVFAVRGLLLLSNDSGMCNEVTEEIEIRGDRKLHEPGLDEHLMLREME